MSVVKKIILRNKSEMQEVAKNFAKKLKPNDVIELVGDVGSGKTFFTRSLAESLGAHNISSPSFVIKNEYKGNEFPILHFDFYRLNEPGILKEMLAEDFLEGNLIIIEWAETIKGILPEIRYKIHFKVTGHSSRELIIDK